MTESFFQRLTHRALTADSLLCVGLDPHPGLLDRPTVEAARDFCLRLIDACSPHACAFKPNSAFFEAWGAEGTAVLVDVIAAIPDDIPVILDAKRGDIASTAEAYARAAFDTLGVDALTASPYLGQDSLIPFMARPERGVFVLCKTSNPGADEFQVVPGWDGMPLFLRVAREVQHWSQYDNVGLVVGATFPQALSQVRAIASGLWFLAPGIGAQGGNLMSALAAGLRPDGMGMLVAVSRSIAATDEPGSAALAFRHRINQARGVVCGKSRTTVPLQPVRTLPGKGQQAGLVNISSALLEATCLRFGRFTLKSGIESPIYVDLRRLASHPRALRVVADAMVPLLEGLKFDRLAAVPYGGLPIGTAVALTGNWSLIYTRREVKEYGTRAEIEGDYEPGETAVLLDDLITTGESKFETIKRLESAGLEVRDVVVLLDREQGALGTLKAAGYRLHAVVTLRQVLACLRETGDIAPEQYEEAKRYLEGEGENKRSEGALGEGALRTGS